MLTSVDPSEDRECVVYTCTVHVHACTVGHSAPTAHVLHIHVHVFDALVYTYTMYMYMCACCTILCACTCTCICICTCTCTCIYMYNVRTCCIQCKSMYILSVHTYTHTYYTCTYTCILYMYIRIINNTGTCTFYSLSPTAPATWWVMMLSSIWSERRDC